MKEIHLLLLLLAVMETRSYVITSGKVNSHNVAEFNADPRKNRTHHVSINCGDTLVVKRTVLLCQRELRHLSTQGYPWFVNGNQKSAVSNSSLANDTNNLQDTLDSLAYVCRVLDRSRVCLQENNILDYCMEAVHGLLLDKDFQFICRHRQRDENLVRSLQCLHDNRMLTMLYFHIGSHCFRGLDILNDLVTRVKRAYFYGLDVTPPEEMPNVHPFYCLPKNVISTCVRDIVEDRCGTMSADMVQDYLEYYQDWYGQVLRSGGLYVNTCEHETRSENTPNRPPILSFSEDLNLGGFLGVVAPGTALDTAWGRVLADYLSNLPAKELCTDSNAYNAYAACVLASDDRFEISKYNIVQFAHQLIPRTYQGTQCNRLEEFTGCWNLLQEICGPKVRGLAQHATLLVEGCKIQSEMDTAGCHWQDMLLTHYMQASRVTAWPMSVHCLHNPMNLENAHYKHSVARHLETVILILQPGVEEISNKCGQQAANRLQIVLEKLVYLQYDALEYAAILYGNNW